MGAWFDRFLTRFENLSVSVARSLFNVKNADGRPDLAPTRYPSGFALMGSGTTGTRSAENLFAPATRARAAEAEAWMLTINLLHRSRPACLRLQDLIVLRELTLTSGTRPTPTNANDCSEACANAKRGRRWLRPAPVQKVLPVEPQKQSWRLAS